MKKYIALFLLVFLAIHAWAQTTIYDTIIPQVRYSYSIGARYIFENAKIHFYTHEDIYSSGSYMGIRETQYFGKYQRNAPALFYQAEWKYFYFGIAPSVSMFNVKNREPTEDEEDKILRDGKDVGRIAGGKNLSWTTFGCDIQLFLKYPLLDRDIKLSIFGGPEFSYNKEFGLNLLFGLDLGYKITTHHIIFLAASAGANMLNMSGGGGFVPIGPIKEIIKIYNPEKMMNNGQKIEGIGAPLKVEVSMGVRTLVYGSGYYYQGRQTGRRR